MRHAVQIWVHGEWRTVATYTSLERMGEARVKAANAFGTLARVKTFPSEREAWL